MTLKVYVAASSAERERAKYCIGQLKQNGIDVTSTWIHIIEDEQHGVPNPREASREDRFRWASNNVNDINKASLLWFLVPTAPNTTMGGWWEHGYAYAFAPSASARAIISSGDTKLSVFTALGQEFASDQDAIAWIVKNKVDIYKNGDDLALSMAFKAEGRDPKPDTDPEGLTKDISEFIARYDCRNPDFTVNPIDLLRQTLPAIEALDDEILALQRKVESLENAESVVITDLKGKLIDYEAQKARIAKLPPWAKVFLEST